MTAGRYITRAPKRAVRCDDDAWSYGRETLDVIVESDGPVATGLTDQHGVPIMRLPSRSPIGFGR